MQKKICPICERPLTGSGYCRLCRKLVFKPLIREVDYYLNETRPGQQTALNERNGDSPGGIGEGFQGKDRRFLQGYETEVWQGGAEAEDLQAAPKSVR